MREFGEEQFKTCWQKTEVIREYERMLYTFGDMTLPYIFVAEHEAYPDRTLVRRGIVYIQKPNIVVPGQSHGPAFKDGFEHSDALPADAVYVMRSMGLPYSEITNKQQAHDEIEYGRLQVVIDQLNETLREHEDTDTGLVKGLMAGPDISLMRYALGLMLKSAPENVRQFFDHIRRQHGESIRPDETITDEDIKRLFG
ncbi:MAG: hypothetical protein ISS77_06485 [Phycisphaerae bacterium]|nr:hypothetical protein [Phycisphaerae bacterium]